MSIAEKKRLMMGGKPKEEEVFVQSESFNDDDLLKNRGFAGKNIEDKRGLDLCRTSRRSYIKIEAFVTIDP